MYDNDTKRELRFIKGLGTHSPNATRKHSRLEILIGYKESLQYNPNLAQRVVLEKYVTREIEHERKKESHDKENLQNVEG
jgi:hypothetical protein